MAKPPNRRSAHGCAAWRSKSKAHRPSQTVSVPIMPADTFRDFDVASSATGRSGRGSGPSNVSWLAFAPTTLILQRLALDGRAASTSSRPVTVEPSRSWMRAAAPQRVPDELPASRPCAAGRDEGLTTGGTQCLIPQVAPAREWPSRPGTLRRRSSRSRPSNDPSRRHRFGSQRGSSPAYGR